MSKQSLRGTLERIIAEFVAAKDHPDAALVEEFTRRYPEFEEPLVEFANELALDMALDGGDRDTYVAACMKSAVERHEARQLAAAS